MMSKLETVEQRGAGGIRGLVDAVDRDISLLQAAPDHRDASAALAHSWAALVGWLALGPAPQTRPCPHCAKTVMLEATRCGYCWADLRAPD
jgi:hypothetical protein